MKNLQKDFATSIIIAIVALLIIGGGVYIYTNNKVEVTRSEENTASNNKQQVEQLLALKFNETIDNTKLVIQKENDKYIVGQTSFGEGGILVMAAKVNDMWELVYTGNAFADCNKLHEYNFPTNFLPEYCKETTQPLMPVACTMDAKQCPDGSYVGRTGSNCEFVCPTNNVKSSITIISPNGGEVIPYGDIYMSGDLMFRWKSSYGENYKPSSNFKAYILDEKDSVIRDDLINTISGVGGGIFISSFIGQTKINTNTKYRIKICDYIDSREHCDTSDDYFIIK